MATCGVQVQANKIGGNKVNPCLLEPETQVGDARKCVLLIEDSEEAMFLVRYAFAEFGRGKYTLQWENCLGDGLSRILRGGIDVVLLDLGLPESSGVSSYAWVREATPDLPVVVLTGDPREETELSVFSGGVDDYLVKDQVSGSRLVGAVADAIAKNAPRHDPMNMPFQYTHKFHWRPKL